ncbi:unnamed protein product [Didymodactylos carnosus]|uniref:Calmodulin n=1 Tax=Didymodactylos carnosus TaxID=1234261 RepID=A0A815NW78_9BILA|nr:unnamed protein product [Didymodactylos carnosus]CAF4318277.1 unnamed protein product [Didymodactylos carnosus]
MAKMNVSQLAEKMSQLEETINYKFKNPALLRQALTRQNAIIEQHIDASTQNYQALEFIGDAALKFIIARCLYKKFGENCTEDTLHKETTKLITNKDVLPQIARHIRFNELIVKGKGEISMTDKMLSDALEAVLGAISIDTDNLEVLFIVVENLWKSYLTKPTEIQTTLPIKKMPLKPLDASSITLEYRRMFSSTNPKVPAKIFCRVLDRVLDVNQRNSGKRGDTALMMLLRHKELKEDTELPKIKALIDRDALWTASNNLGLTAEDLAKSLEGRIEILSKIKSMSDQPSLSETVSTKIKKNILHTATHSSLPAQYQRVFTTINSKSSVEQLRKTVTQVKDINRQNVGKKGDTALMMLLRQKTSIDSIKLLKIKALLEAGALWTASNKLGETAKDLAERHSDYKEVNLENFIRFFLLNYLVFWIHVFVMGLANSSISRKESVRGSSSFVEKLTHERIKQLEKSIDYTEKEIREQYKEFCKEYPEGRITKQKLYELYKILYPHISRPTLFDNAFAIIDSDHSGSIEFSEYLIFKAAQERESQDPEAILKLAFDSLDQNNDQYITIQELKRFTKYVLSLSNIRNDRLQPNDLAKMMMKEMDDNNDKRISKKEFLAACRKQSLIQNIVNHDWNGERDRDLPGYPKLQTK